MRFSVIDWVWMSSGRTPSARKAATTRLIASLLPVLAAAAAGATVETPAVKRASFGLESVRPEAEIWTSTSSRWSPRASGGGVSQAESERPSRAKQASERIMPTAYTLAAPNGIGRCSKWTGGLPGVIFLCQVEGAGSWKGATMGDRDRREDALAPGHWRVTAQPYLAAAAAPAGLQAGSSSLAAAPRRTGGHPLIATAICAGILLLWLADRNIISATSGRGS